MAEFPDSPGERIARGNALLEELDLPTADFGAVVRSRPVADERPLAPLAIAPEDEPREGIVRRVSRGKEWREEQKHADRDEERQV